MLPAFPGAEVFRTAAGIREFLDDGHADLLHVACHARHNPTLPMFSYLEFEDGKVHAVEIARSGLRCGLVTLSACDTGALSLLNRHEPSGLVRAFLARGATAALASLWVLDDEVGLYFSQRYNCELSRGTNVGAAVALARAEIREDFSHPYFWAPMVLFGGYQR